MSQKFFSSRQLWRRGLLWKGKNASFTSPKPSLEEDQSHLEDLELSSSCSFNSDGLRCEEEEVKQVVKEEEQRHVHFYPYVNVYHVPPLVDIEIPGEKPSASRELYWSPTDYDRFKQDAILEIRTFLRLFGRTNTMGKDPATVLYQPCLDCDESLQNDFIYELVTLSKHSNCPDYYQSVSSTLSALFSCPDIREKLFTTSFPECPATNCSTSSLGLSASPVEASFLRHVDTLNRLDMFLGEGDDSITSFFSEFGTSDDDKERAESFEDERSTTTIETRYVAASPVDRVTYPCSLVIGESDPETSSIASSLDCD